MKPQAVYSHDAVREIIEDVTQSSVMRLDPNSMGKLWDLITMVFKWQMSITSDVVKVTQRHLYEIETYIINSDTQLQLHKVQNLMENFDKILDDKEKNTLHEDICFWLRDFNVRVSLLLRMGLQNMDGHFIVNNLNPIAEQMLKNLGENIYAVTQNGKILQNYQQNNNEEPDDQDENDEEVKQVNELQLFVDEMLGERKPSTCSDASSSNILKLSITDDNFNSNDETNTIQFDNIDVNVNEGKLKNLGNDLSVDGGEDEDEHSFRNDLLDLIGIEEN